MPLADANVWVSAPDNIDLRPKHCHQQLCNSNGQTVSHSSSGGRLLNSSVSNVVFQVTTTRASCNVDYKNPKLSRPLRLSQNEGLSMVLDCVATIDIAALC